MNTLIISVRTALTRDAAISHAKELCDRGTVHEDDKFSIGATESQCGCGDCIAVEVHLFGFDAELQSTAIVAYCDNCGDRMVK